MNLARLIWALIPERVRKAIGFGLTVAAGAAIGWLAHMILIKP